MSYTLEPVDADGLVRLVNEHGEEVARGRARPSSRPGFVTICFEWPPGTDQRVPVIRIPINFLIALKEVE